MKKKWIFLIMLFLIMYSCSKNIEQEWDKKLLQEVVWKVSVWWVSKMPWTTSTWTIQKKF